MLHLEDLNILIKYFAYKISKSIESLDKGYHDRQQQSIENQFSDIKIILKKYDECSIESEQQIELARKFSMRIQQIFGFYKSKSRSQAVLIHLERQIKNKLNILLANSIINFGKIVKFVISISDRQILNSHHHSLSIYSVSHASSKEYREGRRLWSRFDTKQAKVQSHDNIKRKTNSVVSAVRTQQNQKIQKRLARKQCIDNILKLYEPILQIDRTHLTKCFDDNQNINKEQLKRNTSVLKKYKSKKQKVTYTGRKLKTELSYDDHKILHQIKSCNKMGVNELLQNNVSNMLNVNAKKVVMTPWKNRRKRIKTALRRQTEQAQCRKIFGVNKENKAHQ